MKKHYSLMLFMMFCLCSISIIAQNEKDIISSYITNNLLELDLAPTDAHNYRILSAATLANKDYKVYYLQQEIDGVLVANSDATVTVKNNSVQNFKHNFQKNITSLITPLRPAINILNSANTAVNKLGLANKPGVKVVNYKTRQDVPANAIPADFESPLYYYKNTNNLYTLVYEIIVKDPSGSWWATKINAINGQLENKINLTITCNFDAPKETDAQPHDPDNHKLHKHTLHRGDKKIAIENELQNHFLFSQQDNAEAFADGSTYNAFPLGVESPNHGNRTLIENPALIPTVGSNPVPSPYGWHDTNGVSGADTQNSTGNNVNAYEDTDNRDAPLEDGSSFANATTVAPITGTLTFDYPLDLTKSPKEYQKAAIVNLFVWNNYMHDVFYAYGFDESNGNFQENNYSRFDPLVQPENAGNLLRAFDPVNAEAQDGDGLNNANMSTLADGFSPTMQMFLWGASPFGEFFDVIEETDDNNILGTYNAARFPFVPIPREGNTPVIGRLVLAQDDGLVYTGSGGGTAGPSPNLSDGCTEIQNAADINGNIAVIRRGVCTFVTKIIEAQNAGAIAVIIVNNVEGDGPVNGGGDPYETITIPTISLSFEDGEALIAKLGDSNADGTIDSTPELVTGQLIDRGPESNLINRDGDLDQGIIAHEYGHGISTRLVGGRTRFDCLLSVTVQEEMGEGWSDFFGLVTTHRPGDTGTQKRGIGTYVQFQGTDGPGIRPAPYSTDFAINDYTYEDIADESLSVPHGVGFVWATIIWDMYWAFIDKYGYDPDIYYGKGGNNMAVQLVMDGLKLLTCENVGFVSGRNAILEADAALYNGENECLIRTVFARRGVGFNAIQGTGNSRSDQVQGCLVDDPTTLTVCEELSEAENPCAPLLSTEGKQKTIFGVYPNPSKTQITITTNRNTGFANVRIYDINAREIINTNVNLTNSATIDVSNFATGVYILKVKTETGETHTQKLIKN